MADFLERISGNWLAWVGSRCWIRTKAMPVVAGRCSRSSVKASSPPADAPTPTMGKDFSAGGEWSTVSGEPSAVCDTTEDMGALRVVFPNGLPQLFFAIPDPPHSSRFPGKQDISARQ